MGKVFDALSEDLAAFIREQPLFFVATAPLAADAHVNLSPKGLDCFRVLSPNQVAYLDLTGSGNETAAHLAENGRITFRFAEQKGAAGLQAHRREKNAVRIDGLPAGFDQPAVAAAGERRPGAD